MKILYRTLPLWALLMFGGAAQADEPLAKEYPTLDRVLYVQQCMTDHPGLYYEMVSKCSCALDAIAKELKYEEFSEMSTAANATTIGGERGSYIRANRPEQAKIKQYREIQARAKKGCFIDVTARR